MPINKKWKIWSKFALLSHWNNNKKTNNRNSKYMHRILWVLHITGLITLPNRYSKDLYNRLHSVYKMITHTFLILVCISNFYSVIFFSRQYNPEFQRQIFSSVGFLVIYIEVIFCSSIVNRIQHIHDTIDEFREGYYDTKFRQSERKIFYSVTLSAIILVFSAYIQYLVPFPPKKEDILSSIYNYSNPQNMLFPMYIPGVDPTESKYFAINFVLTLYLCTLRAVQIVHCCASSTLVMFYLKRKYEACANEAYNITKMRKPVCLRDFIENHQQLNIFRKQILDTFDQTLIWRFWFFTTFVIIDLFRVIITDFTPAQTARMSIALVVSVIMFYTQTYFSEGLEEANEKIRLNLYLSNWYHLPIEGKKQLLMILRRTQLNSRIILQGGMVNFSHETLKYSLKMMYSATRFFSTLKHKQ